MTELNVNGKRYIVKKLLGHGKGGYSWLADAGEGPVVVKQIHHETCDYYQFGSDKLGAERRDYARLCAAGVRMPRLLAVDETAERLVKEYIEGPTVARLVADGALEPSLLEQVRALSERLRGQGLNIDWYPTNFIVRCGEIFYIDYECNDYQDAWSFETWGIRYWRQG